MKFIILVYTIFLVNPSFSSADWYLLNSGTNKQINSIYFTSSSKGFAAGLEGTCLKTTDGGSTWQQPMHCTKSFSPTKIMAGYVEIK